MKTTFNRLGWVGVCTLVVLSVLSSSGEKGPHLSSNLWFGMAIAGGGLCFTGAYRGSKWFLIPGIMAVLAVLGIIFFAK